MNKPLVAAITGVAFGATLTGAILFTRSQTRTRTCHRAVMQRPVVAPPVAHVPYVHPPVVHRNLTENPCPRYLEQPLDTDDQLSEAQTAYVNGDYKCASDLARTVAEKSPIRAYRIIAAAACQTKDLATLKKIERRLDAPARQYTVYVCQRSGITRTKSGWALSEE